MFRRLVSLAFILALVFAYVVPGTAMAQPWKTEVFTSAAEGFPSPADLLAQGWTLLTRLWDKEGCLIDPSGLPAPSSSTQTTPPAQGEEGCLIDPSGLRLNCP
ncbi:MAG TPA: hypothetical protein VEL74_07180 [Thermoanaerobaculia bacterium]|nr:hypothetical protein [Thermoanaerobaculia bacterium]